jgi:hypothetical protein
MTLPAFCFTWIFVAHLQQPVKVCSSFMEVVFITKQTTLIQSITTQFYFNSNGYIYVYVTCFALYLGHPETCQYKNHEKEILEGYKGPLFTVTIFIMLKHKIYNTIL